MFYSTVIRPLLGRRRATATAGRRRRRAAGIFPASLSFSEAMKRIVQESEFFKDPTIQIGNQ